MKRILKILALVILLAAVIGWYFYQKPTNTTMTGKPDFTLNLNTYVNEGIQASESDFNTKYVGKTIQFNGVVKSSSIQTTGSTLFFEDTNENVVVTAAFDAERNAELQTIKAGALLSLKCMCNGMAKPQDPDDLLSETSFTFNRCSIINASEL